MEKLITELKEKIQKLESQIQDLSKPKPLTHFKLIIKGNNSIIDTRYYSDKKRLIQTCQKRQNQCYDLFAYQLYSDNNWIEIHKKIAK